jgi:hypothetical protein
VKRTDLAGWNIGVQKQSIMEANPDGPPGDTRPADGWVFVLTEVIPQTGDTITFAFGRDVRDTIVRELTGGIVLHGGDLPKL